MSQSESTRDRLPAASCLVPQDVSDRMTNMEKTLDEIRTALLGNKEWDRPGLVATVQDQGKRLTRIERMGVYLLGFGGAATLFYKLATDWVPLIAR